jgi:hypothetical protein
MKQIKKGHIKKIKNIYLVSYTYNGVRFYQKYFENKNQAIKFFQGD